MLTTYDYQTSLEQDTLELLPKGHDTLELLPKGYITTTFSIHIP